jgi:putative peptidoglycan lipid II flippase
VPPKRDRTFQTTLYVTLIIFTSKAVGFARDMIRAAYFGTEVANDAYVAANALFYIPILLLTSMITSTMVPLYIDARNNGGLKTANRFASNALGMFSVFAVALSLLMMVFARPLIHLIYSGYDQERLDMAVHMNNIMMPSMVFVVMSILLSSVLNSTKHFIAAQLTGFALSLSMIVSTVWLSPIFGVDALAWGVSFAGILQVLILIPALRKNFRYSPIFRPKDARFKKLLTLGVPALLSMAVTEMSHTVDQAIGSGLNAGDVSSMDYAFRLITFITGVIGVPITTVMFSKMSEKATTKDKQGIIDIVVQSVEVLLIVLLPIVVIGCVLSKDIIRLVYMRGAFNEHSMLVTSGVFFSFLLGVVSFCIADLLNRAFHSMQKTRITMGVSLFVMTTNAAISFLLSRIVGVNGLALGTVISSFMGTAILFVLLRKYLGRLGLSRVAVELGKMLLASGAAFAVSMLLSGLMSGRNDLIQVLLRLIASGGAGILVYLGALKLLRARQLSSLKRMLRRR